MKCDRIATMLAATLGLALLFVPCAHAQWAELPMTGSQPEQLVDRTILAGQSGLAPLLTAQLVDQDNNAKRHRAMVRVQTDGVEIVDSGSARSAPNLDQAHIRYRIDGGEVINSTSLVMEFRDLAPGEHRIQVALAGNDNKPIGHQTTLSVHVP